MARSVSADGNIERSVVVTGDGNSVSLSFGGAFSVPLDRRQINRTTRRRIVRDYDPLPLLAPDSDAFPIVGREAVLVELRAWLDDDSDVSVNALIARAGTGKTRLALELCRKIDGAAEPGTDGWVAGFVRPSDVAAFVEDLATRSFDWQRPTLLVIDYAAAVHRELARWLDQLASEAVAGKLRLLLLDREAPEGFGWWHDLTRPTYNRLDTRRDLFVDADRPQYLPDLEQGNERRALLEVSLAAATRMMGDKAPGHSFPVPGEDPAFDAALASPRFGNPLNLAMAGVIAAESGPVAALALRRLDAARHFARHELGRMERIAEGEGISPLAMEHALGFNGLAGGLELATLREDLAAELEAARLPAASAALADVLMQELPSPGSLTGEGSEPRLGTIQPDLIGEGMIVESLLVGPADRVPRASAIVERAYVRTASRAAEALMRLIQDYGHALEDPHSSARERDVARVVLGLLSALAEAIPDAEIESLETLVLAFPENTTILREAAAEQTRRLADHWLSVASSIDEGDDDLRTFARQRAAPWANNLANRLSDLGQREAALAAAQEAVDLYRALAAAHPDEFTPDLAMSLNNLAGRLGELGQREAALAAGQESLDLRRILAATYPDDFTPDLAATLHNMANRLGDLGQRGAALAAAQESLDLYRALAAARPDEFKADVAGALNNVAGHRAALGLDWEALAAAKEAVDLRRTLAEAYPDAHTPSLASSLSNLANGLSDLGDFDAALPAAQEAVDLYRQLASARPEAFMPNLAKTLGSLAWPLSATGQYEAAVGISQEAVDLFRGLADARPDAFTPGLAGNLSNLANSLSRVGRRGEALAAAQEAVSSYRALVAARPMAFMPDYSMSLSVLGDRLEEVGQLKEAVAADQGSVEALVPLFRAHPEAFAKPMAAYLRDYIRRASEAEIEIDMDMVSSILVDLQPILENAPGRTDE